MDYAEGSFMTLMIVSLIIGSKFKPEVFAILC